MQEEDDIFLMKMLKLKSWRTYGIELFGDLRPIPILHELHSINATLNPE